MPNLLIDIYIINYFGIKYNTLSETHGCNIVSISFPQSSECEDSAQDAKGGQGDGEEWDPLLDHGTASNSTTR